MTGWDDAAYDAYADDPRDYDPEDDWDDYESPAEQAAAEDRALDRHIEEQAAEEYGRHLDEMHGGLACDCPPPDWPSRCRLLLRIPRWTPRRGWHMGTEGLCDASHRSLRAVLRLHRSAHEWDDEPPF